MQWSSSICIGLAFVGGCALFGYEPLPAQLDEDPSISSPPGPTPEAGSPWSPGPNLTPPQTQDARMPILDASTPVGQDSGPMPQPWPTRDASGLVEAGADSGVDSMVASVSIGGEIECGPLACRAGGGEVCCVAEVPGYPVPPATDAYSCEPPSGQCAMQLACDSDDDCPAGKLCCLDSSADPPNSMCTDTCEADTDVVLACSSPSDCPAGTECCGQAAGFFNRRYTQVLCTPTCNELGATAFCHTIDDCSLPGDDCLPSTVIPGRKVCRASL